MKYDIGFEITSLIIYFYMWMAGSLSLKTKDRVRRHISITCGIASLGAWLNIFMALGVSGKINLSDYALNVIKSLFYLAELVCCCMQLRGICLRGNYDHLRGRFYNFLIVAVVSIGLGINLGVGFIFYYEDSVIHFSPLLYVLCAVFGIFYIEMFLAICVTRKALRDYAFYISFSLVLYPVICAFIQFRHNELLLSGFATAVAYLCYLFSSGDNDYESLQTTLGELESTRDSILESRAQAEESDKVKQVFIENMSAEFMKPIPQIELISQEIIDNTDDEILMEYAQQINEAGKHLAEFVDEFTMIAKGEN